MRGIEASMSQKRIFLYDTCFEMVGARKSYLTLLLHTTHQEKNKKRNFPLTISHYPSHLTSSSRHRTKGELHANIYFSRLITIVHAQSACDVGSHCNSLCHTALCTYQFVTPTSPRRAYHGHLTPSLSPRVRNLTLEPLRGVGNDTKPRKVENLTVRTQRAKRKC